MTGLKNNVFVEISQSDSFMFVGMTPCGGIRGSLSAPLDSQDTVMEFERQFSSLDVSGSTLSTFQEWEGVGALP